MTFQKALYMMNAVEKLFEHSIREAKIAGCRTVAILGTATQSQLLSQVLSAKGFEITCRLATDSPQQRSNDHDSAKPLNALAGIDPPPDAIAIADCEHPRLAKDLIYDVPGPRYKGLVLTAPCDEDDGCYTAKYRPIPELVALKNIHKGQRAFIIGNGPSLRKTDPNLLQNEITFGCNAIFLMPNFQPTYYFVEDILVAEDATPHII